VDKTSGVLPFAIKASVDARDLENDPLTYVWHFGDGTTKETTTPAISYTYTKPGDYNITVEVKDSKGAASTSKGVAVYAGNERPVVNIEVSGNKSFYLPGYPVTYSVQVSDKNDTAQFDPANLYVSADYLEGFDKASMPMGHQQGAATISGRNIMLSLDCKSCHKENEKSVGPAFVQVAQKYKNDPNAVGYLVKKIKNGGSGVWGEVAMAAHPTLSETDLQQVVQWVLSLANKAPVKKSLPQSGSVIPPGDKKPNTALILSASYTDKGGNNIKALTGEASVALRSNFLSFTGNEKANAYTVANFNGTNYMVIPNAEGWFEVDSIDLTGVKSINIIGGWQEAPVYGYDFEVRMDAPTGTLLGNGSLLPPVKKGAGGGAAHISISPVTDKAFHTIFIVSKPKDSREKAQAGIAMLQFNAQ
jgi:cytochrome c551/c552